MTKKAAKKKAAKKPTKRSFVFTGDPRSDHTSDPVWCHIHGVSFKFNGAAVKVKDEIAAKLAPHTHFTEK